MNDHPRRRAPRTVAVRLLAAAAAAAALSVAPVPPAASAPGTCNIWWTGAVNNSWTTTSNWSLTNGGASAGRLPTATEFVCMSSAPTRSAVVYPSSNRTVAGLDFGNVSSSSLTVQGGVLTLGSAANGSYDSFVRNLEVQASGTLSGTAPVTLSGDTTATPTRGTFSGSGVLTVPAGATLATEGFELVSRRIVNRGTITHTGCYAYVHLRQGAIIENFGAFVGNSECGYHLYNDATATNRFVNRGTGTIRLTSPTSYPYYLDVPLQNEGTVRAVSGPAYLNQVLNNYTGVYDVATGANLEMVGDVDVAPGSIPGPGPILMRGNTLDVAGGGLTFPDLTLYGTTVTGSFAVDKLTDVSSATFAGSGQLTLPTGSQSLFSYVTLTDSYTVVNRGQAQVRDFYLSGSPTFDNLGTVTNTPDYSYGFYDWSTGTSRVRNLAGGTLDITLPNTADVFQLDVPFSNAGTLRVHKGIVNLTRPSDLVSGSLGGGGVWDARGGNLRFSSNVTANGATVLVGSTGLIQNNTANGLVQLGSNTGTLTLGRSQTINRSLTNSGDLTLQSGTLQPTTFTQSAGLTSIASTGSLRGGGSGVGAIVINGGVLSGAGSVLGPLSGSGTFRPGGPGGAMTVTGSFSPGAGSTYGISVSGPSAPGTHFGKMMVSGAATLTGTLALSTAPGYFPPPGTTYRILEAGSRSGTFSNVTGVNLANNTYYDVSYDTTGVTLTVRPDPVVSVDDPSVTEGNTGSTTNLDFTVSLDQPSTRTVSVDYTTVDQTATAGSDYTAANGTLTFTPAQTSKTVSVQVTGDSVFEPDETLLLRLSNPVNLQVGDAEGTGTLRNDDVAGSTITAVSPSQIGQGATNRAVVISGSGFAPDSAVSFDRSGIGVVGGSTRVVDSNTIELAVTVAGTMATGPVDVTVTDSSGSATCSACLSITPKPVVSAVSPSTLGQGAKQREITVHGTGFQPGAVVVDGRGKSYSTSFVDATTLEALINVPATHPIRNYSVQVRNGDSGVGICPGCGSVIAGPGLSSMSPASAARNSTVSVTLTGTNFVAGARVVGPNGVTFDGVTVTSPTTITATMILDSTAKLLANQLVSVINPRSAGFGSSSKGLLTITSG